MGEQDIRLLIEDFDKKLDDCNAKLHNGNDKNGIIIRWLVGIFFSILLSVGASALYIGSLEQRVSHLEGDEVEIKANMIDIRDWKYNNYFTLYLWAERFGQPLPKPPTTTRGKSIAPNI